jgi:hypothetical protein
LAFKIHETFILNIHTYFHSIIHSSIISLEDKHRGDYLKLQNQQWTYILWWYCFRQCKHNSHPSWCGFLGGGGDGGDVDGADGEVVHFEGSGARGTAACVGEGKVSVWRAVRNRPRLGVMPWLTAMLVAVTPAVVTLVAWAVQAYMVEANPVQTPAVLMALREAIRVMSCSVPVAM